MACAVYDHTIKVSGLQADVQSLVRSVISYNSRLWLALPVTLLLPTQWWRAPVSSFVSLFYGCPARVRLNTRSNHVQKIQIPVRTSLMQSETDSLNEAFCIPWEKHSFQHEEWVQFSLMYLWLSVLRKCLVLAVQVVTILLQIIQSLLI